MRMSRGSPRTNCRGWEPSLLRGLRPLWCMSSSQPFGRFPSLEAAGRLGTGGGSPRPLEVFQSLGRSESRCAGSSWPDDSVCKARASSLTFLSAPIGRSFGIRKGTRFRVRSDRQLGGRCPGLSGRAFEDRGGRASSSLAYRPQRLTGRSRSSIRREKRAGVGWVHNPLSLPTVVALESRACTDGWYDVYAEQEEAEGAPGSVRGRGSVLIRGAPSTL